MPLTVAGIHLGIDIHANRPAANTVPDASFYSCSTHNLIYKSDFAGNSWATWATLSAGLDLDATILASAGQDIADALAGAAAPDAGNVFATMADVGAPGGGGLVLLEQHTAAASASLDFTTCISATYDEYLIELVGLVFSNNTDLWMRISTDGGATYVTGSAYQVDTFVWRGGGAAQDQNVNDSKFVLTFSGGTGQISATNDVLNGSLRLYRPGNATGFKHILGQVMYFDTGPFRVVSMFRGAWETITAVDAFQFLPANNTITTGTIRVYGVEK